MRVQAQDLVALRAASNSFLRFIAASFRAIEVVAPFYRTRQLPDRAVRKLERRSRTSTTIAGTVGATAAAATNAPGSNLTETAARD